MEGPSQAHDFLAAVYQHHPVGYRIVAWTLPDGKDTSWDLQAPKLPASTLDSGQWFVGQIPRGPNRAKDLATHVWMDRDSEEPLERLYPRPTASVLSGRPGGLHAYWRFSVPVPSDRAVRLSKLAWMGHQGDPAVAEPSRIMRLPGYYNTKYDPPVLCTLEALHPETEYESSALEEALVAAIIANYWEEGNRRLLALAVGATLSRADWDVGRVTSVVEQVCRITHDEAVADRVIAARDTLMRRDNGTPVSAASLRDAMGDLYKGFVGALGLSIRDGDFCLNGTRIASAFHLERDLAQYIQEKGEWAFGDGQLLHWDDARWGSVSENVFSSMIFDQLLSHATVIKDGTEVEYIATLKVARALASHLSGTLEGRPIAPPDPCTLPLQNGVLDFTNPAVPVLRPHAPENHNRWVLPFEFARTASAPHWLRFMREAVGDDERLFLQEWFGYLLRAGNPWEQMLWLWGPSGTGKSTFIHGIEQLLKPCAAAVQLAGMSQYSLATLADKRVAFCTEMPVAELRTNTIRALVSCDQIEARHIYGRPFNMKFTGKIVLSTNLLPDIDQTEGLWRRLSMVRFGNKPSHVDEHLKEKISTELPGILNWALGGLRRLQLCGWTKPESVAAQMQQYTEIADHFARFVEDCLEVTGNMEDLTPIGDVYAIYVTWTNEHGLKPKSNGPVFSQELRRLGCIPLPGPVRVGNKVTRAWAGAKLKEVEF